MDWGLFIIGASTPSGSANDAQIPSSPELRHLLSFVYLLKTADDLIIFAIVFVNFYSLSTPLFKSLSCSGIASRAWKDAALPIHTFFLFPGMKACWLFKETQSPPLSSLRFALSTNSLQLLLVEMVLFSSHPLSPLHPPTYISKTHTFFLWWSWSLEIPPLYLLFCFLREMASGDDDGLVWWFCGGWLSWGVVQMKNHKKHWVRAVVVMV